MTNLKRLIFLLLILMTVGLYHANPIKPIGKINHLMSSKINNSTDKEKRVAEQIDKAINMLKDIEIKGGKKYYANIIYNSQNDSYSISIKDYNLEDVKSSLNAKLFLNETETYSCQVCGSTSSTSCANSYTRTTSGMGSTPPITVTSNGGGCYTWTWQGMPKKTLEITAE